MLFVELFPVFDRPEKLIMVIFGHDLDTFFFTYCEISSFSKFSSTYFNDNTFLQAPSLLLFYYYYYYYYYPAELNPKTTNSFQYASNFLYSFSNFFVPQGCDQDFRLGGSKMHNLDPLSKGGNICNDHRLGFWGAVSPLSGPGQSSSRGSGGKPLEALEILRFLLPENGLKTHVFPCSMCIFSDIRFYILDLLKC